MTFKRLWKMHALALLAPLQLSWIPIAGSVPSALQCSPCCL